MKESLHSLGRHMWSQSIRDRSTYAFTARRVGVSLASMAGLRVVQNASALAATIIVGRIIGPEQYGLVATALVVALTAEGLGRVGLQQALVQHANPLHPDMVGTAWVGELAKGMFITLIILGLAPWVAGALHAPEAVALVRALAFLPLIRSLANIHHIYFQRRLEPLRQFLMEGSGALVQLVVAVIAALLMRSAWALALAYLAGAVTFMLVSYLVSPAPPRLRFRWGEFLRLWGFSGWLWASAALGTLMLHLDKLVVARLFSTEMVGLYVMAALLSSRLVDLLGKQVFGWVRFPTYSALQNDQNRLRTGVLRSYVSTITLLLPAMLGIYLVADDIAGVVLGSAWHGIVPILQILALAQLVRVLSVAGSGLFWGIGAPQVTFLENLGYAVVLLVGLLVFTHWFDIVGVGLAIMVASGVAFLVWLAGMIVKTGPSWHRWRRGVLPVLVGLGAMTAVVSGVQAWAEPGLMRLVGSVLVGVAVYGAVVAYLSSRTGEGVFPLVKQAILAGGAGAGK